MRTTSTFLAASLAVATMCGPMLASAQAAPAPHTVKPRYYFPRHVKRQLFGNTTEPATVPSTDAPSSTPEAITTRDPGFLDSLLPGLLPPADTPSDGPSDGPSDASSDEVPAPSSTDGFDLGDLFNPKTTDPVVETPPAEETGEAPEATVAPTSSQGGGLLDGLGSILNPQPTPTPSSPVDTPIPESSAIPQSSGGGGLLDGLGSILNPAPQESSAPVPSEVATPSEPIATDVGTTGGVPETVVTPTLAPTSEQPGLLDPILTGLLPPPSSSGVPEVSVAPTSEQPGLLDPILTGLLPPPSSAGVPETVITPTAPVAPEPTTAAEIPSSNGDITVGLTTAIGTEAEPTPTPSGLFPPIDSILPPLLPIPSSVVESSFVGTGVTPVPTEAPTPTSDILSSLIDGLTSVPLPPAASSALSDLSSLIQTPTAGIPELSSAISSALSDLSTGLPSTAIPTDLSSLISVPPNTGLTTEPTGLTTEPTGISTPPESIPTPSSGVVESGSSIASTDIPSTPITPPGSTASPTDGLPTATPTPTGESSIVSPTEIPSSVPPTTPLEPSSQPTPTAPTSTRTPEHSNVATATNSLTSQVIESSIMFEPSNTVSETVSTPSGMPSDLPQVIKPNGETPQQPPNSTLCQIGFQRELNYPFVVSTRDSPGQIFHFLAQGLTDGLNIKGDEVTMTQIRPYDTTGMLGFVTTLVYFYIPSDMFDKLKADLIIPASRLYNNDDGSVNTLMSLINTGIPLEAGNLPDQSTGNTNGPNSNGEGNGNGGDIMGGGNGSKSPVVASSVGIAFAAIGGVAAYGAAMFFVARRYKKRRAARGHNRTSSIPSTSSGRGSPDMAYNGPTPAWMSGARPGPVSPGPDGRGSRQSDSSNERSVRTAQISGPMMAENSLGWN